MWNRSDWESEQLNVYLREKLKRLLLRTWVPCYCRIMENSLCYNESFNVSKSNYLQEIFFRVADSLASTEASFFGLVLRKILDMCQLNGIIV